MKIKHFFALALVALFAAFGPLERTAPTRWALLIGISDYTNFGDEIGGDLPGAVNDVKAWRDVLVAKQGFTEDRIKMLLDGEATRAGIEAAMTDWLRSQVRPGDQLLIVFAGHGSQMWDTNGDEDDGLDETICPADVTRGSTDKDIADDEIASWLNAIPTDDITIFWDKCHAESSTRAVTPFARPRSLDREVVEDVQRPENATGAAQVMASDEVTLDRVNKPVLEFAASQSDEVAVDAAWEQPDGSVRYGGAFTTFAVRNLWNAPAGASYREIFEQTREDLKRERFAQQPSLTGTGVDRPAFVLPGDPAYAVAPGTAAGSSTGVPVVSVSGSSVELAGGRAAGMTVGSVFRAGPATLRITAVGADRASATVVEGAAGAIPANARARLVAYSYPPTNLSVSVAELPAAARAALAARLEGRSIVLESDARRFSHLIVRPQGSDVIVLGLDGATRHRVPAGDAAALATALEKELGAQMLAELENHARPFPVGFSIAGGKTSFALGDEISFTVRTPRAGYLTVVDLGTDGSVTVIYPNEYVSDAKVTAGQEVVLPSPAMQRADVIFEAQAPVGRGIVRAFVTERPLELNFAQGGLDQASLIAAALRKAAGPAPAGSDALPLSSWSTAALVYEVRP